MAGKSYSMQEKHKDCLQKNRMFLIDNVDYDDINDYMIQENIITSDKDERIQLKGTRRDKIRSLLDVLPYSGPRAYSVFLKALANADRRHVLERLDCTLRGEDPERDEPDRFPVQEGRSERPGSSSSQFTGQGSQDVTVSRQPICSPSDSQRPGKSGLRHSVSATTTSVSSHTNPVSPKHHSTSSLADVGAKGGAWGGQNPESSPCSFSMAYSENVELQSDSFCEASDSHEGTYDVDKSKKSSSKWNDSPSTSSMSSLSLSGSNFYNFLNDLTEEQKKTCPQETLFGALAPQLPSIDILGLNLGFTRVKLQHFKSNNPHSVANQAVEMFASWRSWQFKKATIKRLVRAYQKSDLPLECYQQQISEYFDDSDSSDNEKSENTD